MLSSICFWHPVGAHGGESLAQIQQRKLVDVATYGFTMWSFSPATALRVYAWRSELKRASLTSATVLCCGNNTVDPHTGDGDVTWLTEFSDDLLVWKPLPHPRMTSYHRGPTKGGYVASAFVVTQIDVPDSIAIKRPDHWFRANGPTWEHSTVPTRGEYLVKRPPTSSEGTRLRMTLTVTHPFVVWLR